MTMQVELRMTATELTELSSHEEVIERGLKTFQEVGSALSAIRDGRLYREHYGTFEEYCQQRWQLKQSRAYQLMDAAKALENLASSTIVELPSNESQARPLARLAADAQRQAWQEAVKTAPDGKITGAHVAKVVERYMPSPEPRFIPGEPKPYPSGDILPNGHATEYNPVRLAVTPVTPIEARPLTVTEAEAAIARYLERHGQPDDPAMQRVILDGLTVDHLKPVIRDDRMITHDTFKNARRRIAEDLDRQIFAERKAAQGAQRTLRLSYAQVRALYAYLLIKGLGPNEGDERVGRAMDPSPEDFEAAFEAIRRAALYAPEVSV